VTADAVSPQAPRPPEGQPAATLSGSTIAYLFADLFVPAEKAGKTGMRAFGTGQVVVTGELAGGLVAIGLWQLRERGLVTLEAYSGKKLRFISVSGVRVRLAEGAAAAGSGVGGVEASLLEHLNRSKKARNGGETAWDIANILCIGKDARGAIIGLAIDEAVTLGYLDRVKQEVGVIGRLSGKAGAKLEPVGDRIASLKPAADRLALAWRDFRQGGEADLAKLLRSTTFEGIESRVRGDEDSND
jgi:hypothetical protein